MTAAKDTVLNRTGAQNRLSVGSSASYMHKMSSRPHSHSLSVPSINAAHRVSRRKSMSNTAANREAIAASLSREHSGTGSDLTKRSSKSSKGGFPASLPSAAAFGQPAYDSKYGSAIAETSFLEVLPEDAKGINKARARRASEGSHLRKEGKRVANGELRCDTCGKGYKHSSCLNKHLWEHTPEWQITSKLLISKHQQVQLLEAASVLVAMNHPGDSAIESDNTPSPAASGSSDPQDSEMSSIETTPPPQLDDVVYSPSTRADYSKRYSANSSAYSQSYQSSVFSESAPGRTYMSHHNRQYSNDGRPTTSGTSVNGGDDAEHADLTAAVGLLSCSFGTPKSQAVLLSGDIPPVPPLPQKYMGSQANYLSGTTLTYPSQSYVDSAPAVSTSYSCIRGERKNVDMDADMSDEELDRHRGRSDEDDEGMFGKMEE